jgi:hypothetical protein
MFLLYTGKEKKSMNHLAKQINLPLRLKIFEVCGGQWKFAQLVGIHESTISKMVRYQRPVPPEMRKKFAKILGCRVQDIFSDAE